MKKTYVLEQRTIKLEIEIADLKNNIINDVEIREKDVQIEGQTHDTRETLGHPIEIDEENLKNSKDVEIRAMKNLLIHKINALKVAS